MPIAFRVFPGSNVVALFEEAAGGGDPEDINSPRNAPALDPDAHLDKVYMHSDLNNLEVLADMSTVVSHASVAGTTVSGLSSSTSQGSANGDIDGDVRYGSGATTHLLYQHDAGYEPDCIVVVDDSKVLFPGMPIQTAAGRGRYVSPYVTTSQIRIREWSSVGSTTLAALSRTYRVIAFREQRIAVPGKPVFGFDQETGEFVLAKGRISARRRYLQVVPGGSPFSIAYGKQMDLQNGAVRFVNPDGTVFEPAPAGLRMRLVARYPRGTTVVTQNLAYSSALTYSGTFAGAPQVLVQAP